jgi:hypothetical protein
MYQKLLKNQQNHLILKNQKFQKLLKYQLNQRYHLMLNYLKYLLYLK